MTVLEAQISSLVLQVTQVGTDFKYFKTTH
jgi:hypothetical protein